ncbi:MAG TPA: FAD-dependent oxidoreductase [Rhizomicrobium sp.]|nr:FAD-dependent oxidoreductase [Rhizomicrobium sp.]
MRYDVGVIGAGADGLAAAATLAGAGLKTIVIERSTVAGGRAQTREFHPGFRASPFADEVAAVPREIHWALDLTRRGAIFAPMPSLAMWPDRHHILQPSRETEARCAGVLARVNAVAASPPPRFGFLRTASYTPWPAEDWAQASLTDVLGEGDEAAHRIAATLAGRTADPYLAGSALHLLAESNSGVVLGGLARLASALTNAAREAGAEFSLGLEASDIQSHMHRVTGIGLADGTEISARAIISTVDLKRTFLSLFPWSALPPPVVKRAGLWRMGGGTARVLLALEKAPDAPRSAIHVAPDAKVFAEAHAAWRAGTIPTAPPATLRLISAADPSLAPIGSATLTVTLGAIPFRLFDGAWTHEKRDVLRALALAAAESVFPGVSASVLAAEVIAPPDIEEALGATEGDLMGGEIASDQMLGLRPGPRTEMAGLYLGGPSSAAGPLGACAAGVAAARAVLADFRRLK